MSKEIRAHLFRTIAEGATAASLEKAVIAFAKSPPAAVSFSHEGVDYLAKEFAWSQNHSLFAGTIYRLKERGLPVKVHGQQTQPIPLATGESLGEPASFAWMPKSHAVLLHYAHNGPRHTALKPLLSKMGFAGPVIIEPVIRTDMLVKLRGATRFSHVEFTLHDPAGAPKLRAVGGAVGGAAKINEVLGSINIKVVATMGHSQGDGLLKDAVRSVGNFLSGIANESDGAEHVKSVRVSGVDGDGDPFADLDLLAAREVVTLSVDEDGRHLDVGDCQTKLCKRLFEFRSMLDEQAGVG